MHELSIALSIVEMAEEEAERRKARIEAIHVQVGPLSGVIKDALAPAFELAVEGTSIAGCRLVVEEVPVVVFCPVCREEKSPDSFYWLRCPDCDTPTPEVRRGTELQVTSLELDITAEGAEI